MGECKYLNIIHLKALTPTAYILTSFIQHHFATSAFYSKNKSCHLPPLPGAASATENLNMNPTCANNRVAVRTAFNTRMYGTHGNFLRKGDKSNVTTNKL